MVKTIAVEGGLSPVKEFLQRKGYHVVNITTEQPVDAAVVSGLDSNIMNIQNVVMEAPVINAQGRSPEDVVHELESRLLH